MLFQLYIIDFLCEYEGCHTIGATEVSNRSARMEKCVEAPETNMTVVFYGFFSDDRGAHFGFDVVAENRELPAQV